MQLTPIKTENGWELWDGVALQSEVETYASKKHAIEAAQKINGEFRHWDGKPFSDAPHSDNH